MVQKHLLSHLYGTVHRPYKGAGRNCSINHFYISISQPCGSVQSSEGKCWSTLPSRSADEAGLIGSVKCTFFEDEEFQQPAAHMYYHKAKAGMVIMIAN